MIAVLCSVFAADSMAQRDRDVMEFYEASFEKYLGKEVTVMVADATRVDAGQHEGVAIFHVYTQGRISGDWAYAVLPISEAEAFGRRYATRDYTTRRPLRGTFSKTANNSFYISVNGAKFPEQEFAYSEQDESRPKQPEQPKLPAYDDSPLASFSYDGKRLVEARIVEITPNIVKLSDKNGLSLQVPTERAVKMPDLRMKAKAALEAAQAANAEGEAVSEAR
jgi:hypothetical protein